MPHVGTPRRPRAAHRLSTRSSPAAEPVAVRCVGEEQSRTTAIADLCQAPKHLLENHSRRQEHQNGLHRAEAGKVTDGYHRESNPKFICSSATYAPTPPSPTRIRTLWCARICPSVEPIPKPSAVLNLRSNTFTRQTLFSAGGKSSAVKEARAADRLPSRISRAGVGIPSS